ncbi:hypothetical protein BC833DRAFT_586946 [Globomyces pollinis-pini]|nr:hypothetical protein BC833DRAFT_586946 [Globomyces pollinis-pini]
MLSGLSYTSFIATVATLLFTLHSFIIINNGKIKTASFRYGVLLLQVFNVIFLLLLIVNAFANDKLIGAFGSFFGGLLVFGIVLVDSEVLKLFNVLNPRISNSGILVLRIVQIVLYVGLCFVWTVLNIVFVDKSSLPEWLRMTISLCPLGYIPVQVLYDTLQNIYLIQLVMSTIQRKQKETVTTALSATIRQTIFIVSLDFVGLALFTLQKFTSDPTEIYYQFSCVILAFHVTCMIYMYLGLVQLKQSEWKGTQDI